MLRVSNGKKESIQFDPTMNRLDNRIARLLRLISQNSYRNRYLNTASRNQQGLVLLDLRKLILKGSKIFLVANEWLDDRMLNRQCFSVGLSGSNLIYRWVFPINAIRLGQ